ncbi:MAG: carboxylesterase/lipase family protein [Dehalococcoidales bacterium]|nr:carboxylesterase/lipase family protein [Dehalococcoidales bacterium]
MSAEKQAIVTTKNGKLEGYTQDGLYVFKGVPYAAPPVGSLRWLPPQPPESWSGVRPAKEFDAIAPQNAMPFKAPGMFAFDEQLQDESCLFLNIWTPGLDGARRPVMFWIHGGAFIIGSGTEPFLENGELVRRGDIVLVSINYRMGAYGFMNLKELTGGKIPATGNEGLLDQVAALDWVHDNIAAFGGDPDNITVFGFSAGGMSIGCLLGMPAARGKFHKTINRSGAANTVDTLDSAVKISRGYLKILNVKENDIDSLRKLTTQQLMDAQQELGNRLRETEYRITPFQPVVDGEVIPEWPLEAIRKGSAKNVSVMAGNMLDEMKAMTMMDPATSNMSEEDLLKRLNDLLPLESVPDIVKLYRGILEKRGEKLSPANIMGTLNVALMFRIPTIRLIEAQRDVGAPAYNYLFTYKSPAMGGVLGAMHGVDNPFLFGQLDPNLTGNGPEARSLAVRVQDACVAFARTGDPSCKSAGKWPVYGKDRMTMIFDVNTRVEADPYQEERLAWETNRLTHTRPL